MAPNTKVQQQHLRGKHEHTTGYGYTPTFLGPAEVEAAYGAAQRRVVLQFVRRTRVEVNILFIGGVF